MIGAEAGDLAFQEFAVGLMDPGDLVTIDDEDAALAVLGFLDAQEALFAGEEGLVSPGGTDEEASGIVGRGHGGKALVVDGGEDVLRLVEDEQRPGRSTDDVGVGLGREEHGAGLADAEAVTGEALPLALEDE